MSTYYMRDGILYTTKTCCNLVEFWQHEARVYPDEVRRGGIKMTVAAWAAAQNAWDDAMWTATETLRP